MKPECWEAYNGFNHGIPEEFIFYLVSESADQPCTERKPTHKDRQYQRLRIGRVTKHQLEILGPDGFINETAESRAEKQQQNQQVAGLVGDVEREGVNRGFLIFL